MELKLILDSKGFAILHKLYVDAVFEEKFLVKCSQPAPEG